MFTGRFKVAMDATHTAVGRSGVLLPVEGGVGVERGVCIEGDVLRIESLRKAVGEALRTGKVFEVSIVAVAQDVVPEAMPAVAPEVVTAVTIEAAPTTT